jgi:glycosyltransferase involved in cell wall biosynthesis
LAGSLTFIIPVFNEEGSLQQLARQISSVMARQEITWRAIFVDDGSSDGSWKLIQQISCEEPRFEGIRLRKRFGKAAALAAGFLHSSGDWVAMLDGDLQDDPAEIPAMLQLLDEQKLDLVSGWKKQRHDPWHKVFPSRVFNAMVSFITGVKLHDHNCGLKVMKRTVVEEIQLYGERHRFIPVLAAARGFAVGEKVVQHRRRQHGRSKYGVGRFFKGFLDLITVRFLMSYSHRPQHLLGILGMLFAFLGFLGMGYLAWDWFQPRHTPLHQRPLLIYSVASLLLGVQFFSIGLLAELITSQRRRAEDGYSIAEKTRSKE